MKLIRYFLLLVAVMVAGCSTMRPIKNITDQRVPSGLTKVQVVRAIRQAIIERQWHIVEGDAEMIQASITSRGHTATVMIPYSSTSYSILYHSSSQSLQADGNTIHRFYNNWVVLLNDAIQSNLQKMK